jgi:magnesium chelatase subunit H
MNSSFNSLERDAHVMRLSQELAEIEQRLIPTGLHVFGRAAELREKADLLRMVASFDRPEHGARSLPKLVAEALGIDSYDELLQESAASETRELVEKIVAAAVDEFCQHGSAVAANWLKLRAGVEPEKSLPTFAMLADVAQRLDSNNEMDSLVRALRGEYIKPGPGADIVQNPLVLPTGRNTHAVNPYSVPSPVAFTRAKLTAAASSLLRRAWPLPARAGAGALGAGQH